MIVQNFAAPGEGGCDVGCDGVAQEQLSLPASWSQQILIDGGNQPCFDALW